MIKVVFFDIDGTLLSHKSKCVPQSARKAIDFLKEHNVKVVACTGRHILELDSLPLDGVTFDAYILLNGQLCLDSNRNVLFGDMMDDYDEIIRLFNEKKIPIQILEKSDTYINFVNDYVVKSLGDISTLPPKTGEYTGNPFYQAVAFLKHDDQHELENKLKNCKIARWHDMSVDIISKNAGKVSGIEKYLKLMAISHEETMAIGDGENDIEMIEYIKYGVAMGNAEDSLKKIADYITDDIDEDGIYNAIKHFRDLII